jgi:ABC-type multidrug transport system ATPase subunit
VGLVPLAVSTGGEREIWPPFARALLGGLLFSPVISLVFVPCGLLVFGRLRDLIRTLGPALVALATALTLALLWEAYFGAEIVLSEPLRWLMAFPAWLVVLGIVRAVQALVRGERPPELVGDGPLELRVRNARKIYGGPPRWLREWARVDRWAEIARRAGLGPHELAPPPAARRDLVWKAGGLALIGYLLSVATTTWGLALLAIPALALASSAAGSVLAALGRPGAWPPRGWAGRALPAGIAAAAWTGLLLARREGSAADVVVLVLAAIGLATWSIAHLAVPGGLVGIARRRIAPEPVVALDGVSLRFDHGLYGLLGPNGAGKSTLMRLVVNLYRPTRGTVTVNGHDVTREAASLQPRIGYLPQFFGLPPRLTARRYLHHQALLAGRQDLEQRRALVESVLAEVGLSDRGDEPLGGFSGGMRQRVGIARTLLNVPRIVVVDEPTVGLDPRERIRFRNLLAELARTRVVLLSTHVVEDIGSGCREVIVLDGGSVRFRGTPAGLAALAEGQAWIVDVPEAAAGALSRAHRVGSRPADAEDAVPTLEDGYLLLLGREARHAA